MAGCDKEWCLECYCNFWTVIGIKSPLTVADSSCVWWVHWFGYPLLSPSPNYKGCRGGWPAWLHMHREPANTVVWWTRHTRRKFISSELCTAPHCNDLDKQGFILVWSRYGLFGCHHPSTSGWVWTFGLETLLSCMCHWDAGQGQGAAEAADVMDAVRVLFHFVNSDMDCCSDVFPQHFLEWWYV